ncbi:hypothetical protein [Rhizobium etli]|uniref:hypothetical protein n=1 Tax=Rhizobium etli TaxID=29449 RepID=UPI0012DB1F26|nr:hypothetical protein [Rhizobium etli]
MIDLMAQEFILPFGRKREEGVEGRLSHHFPKVAAKSICRRDRCLGAGHLRLETVREENDLAYKTAGIAVGDEAEVAQLEVYASLPIVRECFWLQLPMPPNFTCIVPTWQALCQIIIRRPASKDSVPQISDGMCDFSLKLSKRATSDRLYQEGRAG